MDRPMEVISRPFWQGTVALRSRVQGRNWLGVLMIVLLMALIGLLQLDQQATISTAKAESRSLDAEFVALQRECRYWQAESAALTSMSELMSQAPVLGLYRPQEIVKVRVAPLAQTSSGASEKARDLTPADNEMPWWYTPVAELESWIRSN